MPGTAKVLTYLRGAAHCGPTSQHARAGLVTKSNASDHHSVSFARADTPHAIRSFEIE